MEHPQKLLDFLTQLMLWMPTPLKVGSNELHLSPAWPWIAGMPSERYRHNGSTRDRYRNNDDRRRGRHNDPPPLPSFQCRCNDSEWHQIHTRQLRTCRQRPNGPGYWSSLHELAWIEYEHVPETQDGLAFRATSIDDVGTILTRLAKEGEAAWLRRCLDTSPESHYNKMRDQWEKSSQDYTKFGDLVPWTRNTLNDYRT